LNEKVGPFEREESSPQSEVADLDHVDLGPLVSAERAVPRRARRLSDGTKQGEQNRARRERAGPGSSNGGVVNPPIVVTNPGIIRRAIGEKASNTVLIKLNQIGAPTET
jgi:hypothetical protein